MVRQIVTQDAAFDRSPQEMLDAWNAFVERMEQNSEVLAGGLASIFVSKSDTASKRKVSLALQGVTGLDLNEVFRMTPGLEDMIQFKTRENVRLIKSLRADTLAKYEQIILNNVPKGLNANQTFRDLKQAGEISERRAKFIARDQTSKFSSALNQERMKQVGVTEYRWRTARDERVRSRHRQLHGKTFKLSEPPTINGKRVHPGEDFNCRCIMEPIIK